MPTAPATGYDDGRVKRFLDAIWSKEKLNDAEGHALMEIAMAASYDPDPDAPLGFRLPIDLETGELAAGALEAMAEARPDPSRRQVPGEPEVAARHLRGLRLARPVSSAFRRAHPVPGAALYGIKHTYEEFDDTHSSVDYRMDVSLPFLYRALKP